MKNKKWPRAHSNTRWVKIPTVGESETADDGLMMNYAKDRMWLFSGSNNNPMLVWLVGSEEDGYIKIIHKPAYQGTSNERIKLAAVSTGWGDGTISKMIRMVSEKLTDTNLIQGDPLFGINDNRDVYFEVNGQMCINVVRPKNLPHWGFWMHPEPPKWEEEEEEIWEAFKQCLEATHGEFGLEYWLRIGAWKVRYFHQPIGKIIVPIGPTGSGKSIMSNIIGRACVGNYHFNPAGRLPKGKFVSHRHQDLFTIPHENQNVHEEAVNNLKALATEPIVSVENKFQTPESWHNATLWVLPFNDLTQSKWTAEDRRIIGLSAPYRNTTAIEDYLGKWMGLGLGEITDKLVNAVRKGFIHEWFSRGESYQKGFILEEMAKDWRDQIDPDVIRQFQDSVATGSEQRRSPVKSFKELIPWFQQRIEVFKQDQVHCIRIIDGKVVMEAETFMQTLEDSELSLTEHNRHKLILGRAFSKMTDKLGLERKKRPNGNKGFGMWPIKEHVMEPLEELIRLAQDITGD